MAAIWLLKASKEIYFLIISYIGTSDGLLLKCELTYLSLINFEKDRFI